MTKEPKVSELMTMPEAAQYCGRSRSQVLAYARSGRLRAWKVGVQWLTTQKEIDRYFEARYSRKRWLNFFQRMSKFAKIRAEYCCERCGRPEGFKIRCHILTVYHLDGDESNWEPENLSAVCWLCYWYLQKHCHQLALPGIEHPLQRLKRLRMKVGVSNKAGDSNVYV